MKYPLRGIIVDGIKLNREQERRFLADIQPLVRKESGRKSKAILFGVYALLFIVFAPISGAFGVFGDRLALMPRLLLAFVLYGSFAIVGIYVCAAVRRRLYIRQMRHAMRKQGYELCPACGYWLKGLDDSSETCPECGTPREAMPPESKDKP